MSRLCSVFRTRLRCWAGPVVNRYFLRGPYMYLASRPLTADCAICSDGYAESLSYTCGSCSDRKARLVAMVALSITVMLGVAFLGYMVSKERNARPGGRFHRLKRLLPLQSLKIVIVVWQILTEVSHCLKYGIPSK